MNKEIQEIVEQLNDKDKFIYLLAKDTNREMSTIMIRWIKKDGFDIKGVKNQEKALRLALKLKKQQDEKTNNIKVNL